MHGIEGESRKGQLSTEALLAFAFLLAALSFLAFAASRNASSLLLASEISRARFELSHSALCIDEAGHSLSGAAFRLNAGGTPISDGAKIASYKRPGVQEALFHNISVSQGGVLHVQAKGSEPV
ncbi:MAG: hypothetical protein WC588_01390 [Candidatus Micrarchaeia archaeon]